MFNQHPDLVAKLRHPTYKKYYHGTSADFNLSDARMGNEYNTGLHASDTPTIAESMKSRGEGTNPKVKEFWAPEPSTETIDVHNNGIEQLQTNYTIEPLYNKYDPNFGYDAAGDNSLMFRLIREAGGNPFMASSSKFNLDKAVSLNLRKSNFPKIPKLEYPRIDKLLKELKLILGNVSDRFSLSPENRARLSEINTEAAKIMSEYGHKVVKYNNTNPFEGGGGASYFITDPSVIYEHTPFNIPSIPWFPKINLQTNN